MICKQCVMCKPNFSLIILQTLVLNLLASLPQSNQLKGGFLEDSYHMHVKFSFIKIHGITVKLRLVGDLPLTENKVVLT